MALLFDDDYRFLAEVGIDHTEDEPSRFLIFKDFSLPGNIYVANDLPRTAVDVLYVIPPNYNTAGGDMFWVHPRLYRANGEPIPNANGPGEDSRTFAGIEYLRWSRHWNNRPWKPKIDNIRTIVDRLTWAFANPDAKR